MNGGLPARSGFSEPFGVRDWYSANQPGGDRYSAMVAAARSAQDSIVAAAAPGEVLGEAAELLRQITEVLAPYEGDEGVPFAGRRGDLAGRGHPWLVPLVVVSCGSGVLHGRVRFTRTHLGAGGAVHGGGHPMLFDEALGTVAADVHGPIRTARLTVNYRALTPVDRSLDVVSRIDRVEGRKLWVSGEIIDGTEVLASAEALYLTVSQRSVHDG